ncbi:ComEC/Rec2 family competence protein [Psychroserpens ponticola]|uniref:ComEC/Rec2 family competence protein n=1 Tax=Psychroserpens ponticola TaxID=2932268 RepID=A0ABY7RVQ2_9FLAO|nr:ComEC/Rec2 family competence protein [Psychroserpens ponticola]WCO01177.1 ComEC/Rec2 family competence protein [Psychroserpens ponticola]
MLHFSGRTLKKAIWFGVVAYLVMFSLGILSYNSHQHKNYPSHYINIKNIEAFISNEITLRIKERLKPTRYHNKYVVELLKVNQINTQGNVLLNIEKNDKSKLYDVDEVLLIRTAFQEIKNPLNPNQFNYKAYLEKQYIYHQLFTEQQLVFQISSTRETILGYADDLRQTINTKLKGFNFKPEELAIINALILGQRQDMNRDMYTDYANAGAIHILAVSGLHVGIILMMLNFILRPLENLKRGSTIKVIIILILLWSFAVVAGLSASVTRAVTMFSIVAIAMHLKRRTNIYNTLSISIFILLLVKPMFLFDVGFQMSYLAVFAIVSIQPLLQKLWMPKWKVTNYFWQIFTVTIAAQLGVAPISLFYFHQFPGLFFISNLAIIPFLGLILGFGILVILLSLLNVLPEAIANLYGSLISSMNYIVTWVSKQESFLIKDISFEFTHVISTYLFLFALILVYKKFRFKQITFLLVSILILQSVSIYTKSKNSAEAFIIFHKTRYSVIGKKQNTSLKVWHNLDSSAVKTEKMLSSYNVGSFIKSITYDSLHNVYKTPHKTLLVIDSVGIYQVRFKPDIILLRNSPRINLKRMIDSLQPQLIIADGSNYKSYVKRWKATCLKEKLLFHQTNEKGAFIIK